MRYRIIIFICSGSVWGTICQQRGFLMCVCVCVIGYSYIRRLRDFSMQSGTDIMNMDSKEFKVSFREKAVYN